MKYLKSFLILFISSNYLINANTPVFNVKFNEKADETENYVQSETEKIIDSIIDQVTSYYTKNNINTQKLIENIKNNIANLDNKIVSKSQLYLLTQTLTNFVASILEQDIPNLLKKNNNNTAKELFDIVVKHLEITYFSKIFLHDNQISQRVKNYLHQYLENTITNLLKPRTTILQTKAKYKEIDLTIDEINETKKNASKEINKLTQEILKNGKQTSNFLKLVLDNTKKETQIINQNYEQEIINSFAESI